MINESASFQPKEYKAVRKKITIPLKTPNDNVKTNDSGITVSRVYTNNTGKDITVCERSGLKHIVNYKAGITNGEFIIRNCYNVSQSNYDNLTKLFTTIADTDITDLSTWKKGFEANVKKSSNGVYSGLSTSVDTESVITLAELEAAHGDLYLVESDVFISLKGILECSGNPFTDSSLHNKSMEDFLVDNITSFGLKIDIIDNDNSIGKRYIKILNDIRTIHPTKCDVRSNGIIVSTRDSAPSGVVAQQIVTHIFEISELEKLGLYKTKEEAEYAGDTKLYKSEKLAQLEHDNLVLRSELMNEKTKAESEVIELKKQFTTFENNLKQEALLREREHKVELDRMSLQRSNTDYDMDYRRQRVKDHYEERSHERKDSSEIIKYLPAAVIGIGAVGYAAVKLFSDPVSSIAEALTFW